MFPAKQTFSPTAAMTVEEYNKTLLQCWQVLQSGRRVAIHRSVIQITDGDIKAATFLSQLMYWLRVGTELDKNAGWIYKSIQEMELETGLTTAEQRSCKDKLKAAGFIETKIVGGNRELAFRINIDNICKAVSDNFNVPHISQITLEDWRRQELDFFRDYFNDSIVYHMSLVHLTGDIYTAIMLSDILYNCSRNSNAYTKQFRRKRLYATSTIVEWEDRTFLSRSIQERGRKFLKHYGLIVEAHYIRNARIFTHPDGLLLMEMLKQRIRLPKVSQQNKSANAAADQQMQQQSLLPQSGSDECGNVATDGISADQDANSCNSKLRNPATSADQNANSCNSKLRNPATSADQNANSCNSNIKNPTGFSTTKTTTTNSQLVVVVNDVENKDGKKFVPAGKYADLDFPDCIAVVNRPHVLKLFTQHLPTAETKLLQEIIDEVAAKIDAHTVKNVIGYFNGIVRNAANNNFTPADGISYRRKRNDYLKYRKQEEQRIKEEETKRKAYNENQDCEKKAEKEREKIREHLKKISHR